MQFFLNGPGIRSSVNRVLLWRVKSKVPSTRRLDAARPRGRLETTCGRCRTHSVVSDTRAELSVREASPRLAAHHWLAGATFSPPRRPRHAAGTARRPRARPLRHSAREAPSPSRSMRPAAAFDRAPGAIAQEDHTISLTDYFNNQYVGSLEIGTPPQKLTVVFDTGAATWLPAKVRRQVRQARHV